MSDRPILLFGATGQIGYELDQVLSPRFVVFTPHHTEVDFTKAEDLRTYIRIARPCIIINAAAYNDVAGAEDVAALAMAINADAPRIMAEDGPILIRIQVKPVITTNLGVIQTWESNAVMPRQMRSVKAELAG